MSWFINNKYARKYFALIEKARTRGTVEGYSEKHHIIPRSLGGSNAKENIMVLTAREHFICHLLLTKMTNGRSLFKMKRALMMITPRDFKTESKRYIPISRLYTYARVVSHETQLSWWENLRNNPAAMEKHRAALRTGAANRPEFPIEHKQKLSTAGELRGYKYIIQSPAGDIFKPNNFAAFCREHNINHRMLTQAFRNGQDVVRRGSSKGWKVVERN